MTKLDDMSERTIHGMPPCRYCAAIDVPEACQPEHTWWQVETLANALYDAMPLAEETETYGRDHHIGFGFIQDAVAIVDCILFAAEVPSWMERQEWMEEMFDPTDHEWVVEMRPEAGNAVARFAVNGIEFYVPCGEGFSTPVPWTTESALEAQQYA